MFLARALSHVTKEHLFHANIDFLSRTGSPLTRSGPGADARGGDGGYSLPPPWHTIFIFSCHRYENVKHGPPQNEVDEIRGVFIFGGRLAFISNFGLQPPTVEIVPNSDKWA